MSAWWSDHSPGSKSRPPIERIRPPRSTSAPPNQTHGSFPVLAFFCVFFPTTRRTTRAEPASISSVSLPSRTPPGFYFACAFVNRPSPPFQFRPHLPPGGGLARSPPPDPRPPARGPTRLDSVSAAAARAAAVIGDAVERCAAPGGRLRRCRRSKGEKRGFFFNSTVCPVPSRILDSCPDDPIWGMCRTQEFQLPLGACFEFEQTRCLIGFGWL
jgi:hypothetical protein